MTTTRRPAGRRTAVGILAGALALSGAVATALPASAAAGFGFDRVAGNDRYETSAAATARFRATGPAITNVIIASGESGRTPDALAANFLAGVRNAPVLLTRRDTTPAPILAELRALRAAGATSLTVIGGPVAVSATQAESFRALGFTSVTRLAGDDRFETALEVVAAGEGSTASNIGLIASGTSTIDALAGGPLSYKGKHPLFLVTRDDIPDATEDALVLSGVTQVYVLGGEARVSEEILAELEFNDVQVIDRLSGADRSETSVRIAEALIATQGFTNTTFNLASGTNEGIDALSGAALSAKENRALLITNSATSAAPVVAFANRNAARLNAIGHIFGGPDVVSGDLQAAITAAGGGTQFGTVALTSSSVQQGGTLTGTIAGEDISAASVSGCGLTDAAIPADTNSTAGRQFTITVPAGQAPGSCSLVFSVTQAGGGAVTRTVPVTVTAAPDTQAPAVTAQTTAPVAGSTSVVFTASENLDAATVTTGDFTVTGGASQPAVTGVAVQGGTITVTTGALVEGNVVTLAAGSVSDIAGNAGPAAAVATAGTTPPPDTTPPTVVGAQALDATTIVVTFSEAVSNFTTATDVEDFDNFTYVADPADTAATPVAATTGVLSADGRSATLTFPAGTVAVGADADDLLRHRDGSTALDGGDLIDAAQNQLGTEAGEPVLDVAPAAGA